MIEYRDNDQRGVGYCPACGAQLANLSTGLRGYCGTHGWTFANFTTNRDPGDEHNEPSPKER